MTTAATGAQAPANQTQGPRSRVTYSATLRRRIIKTRLAGQRRQIYDLLAQNLEGKPLYESIACAASGAPGSSFQVPLWEVSNKLKETGSLTEALKGSKLPPHEIYLLTWCADHGRPTFKKGVEALSNFRLHPHALEDYELLLANGMILFLEAGCGVAEALHGVYLMAEPKSRVRKVMEKLCTDFEDEQVYRVFSEVLKQQRDRRGRIFSDELIELVTAGELSGNILHSLDEHCGNLLKTYWAHREELT